MLQLKHNRISDMKNVIKNYAAYGLIAVSVVGAVANWSRPDIAIAWLVASLGWIAYKFEV